MEELEYMLDLGAEGLVANNPHSSYEHGRSNSILKIKVDTIFLVFLMICSALPRHRSESLGGFADWFLMPTVRTKLCLCLIGFVCHSLTVIDLIQAE